MQENQVHSGVGPASPQPLRVVIVYKRDAYPDEALMRLIAERVEQSGHAVFIDRHLTLGVEWAKEIEREIRQADAIIPLLSAEAAGSEMLGYELEMARDAARERHGRPQLLPIRVNYTGPLVEPMAGILDAIQYLLWESANDSEGVVTELLDALGRLPVSEPAAGNPPPQGRRFTPPPKPAPAAAPLRPSSMPAVFESVGGAVPLRSEFYLPRPSDGELHAAIARQDSIVLIKGARQMGKTSLLARGLEQARGQGMRVAFTDFQKLNAAQLENVNGFYLTLAESLADQLRLAKLPAETWDERRGPNVNFERYLRREVLAGLEAPLVWGLDEVDRLFGSVFSSEVFGLFRSWHNERALDPACPWAGLTLTIAYATEAHLFIADLNQSPFNVGTRLTVEDFTPLQTAELNRRYGHPLKTDSELNRFTHWVGGHPYLVRRGLHELSANQVSLESFESLASRDEGFYGDHLRRILVLLVKDSALTEIARGVLRGEPCPTPESFYRLRSAGVIVGATPAEARPRCRLYATYLKRHLA
jgi:hypothetical protein